MKNYDKRAYNRNLNAVESDEDLYELIDRLEMVVDQARSVPFSGNCVVDKEEMFLLISMIREHIPVEVKEARILLEENRLIVTEARKEADSIMREAERRMTAMIDEHEITNKAKQQAAQILDNANNSASGIRRKSLEYARKKLSDLEEELTQMLVVVQKNKKELNQ